MQRDFVSLWQGASRELLSLAGWAGIPEHGLNHQGHRQSRTEWKLLCPLEGLLSSGLGPQGSLGLAGTSGAGGFLGTDQGTEIKSHRAASRLHLGLSFKSAPFQQCASGQATYFL